MKRLEIARSLWYVFYIHTIFPCTHANPACTVERTYADPLPQNQVGRRRGRGRGRGG